MTEQQIYSKTGKGADLLFLHGWKQNRHTWDGIVEQLKEEFTCWTLDLPGFGQNPRPKEAWTPAHYANWVATFIDEHKIKDVTVIGHSFGGRIAICLAASLSSQGAEATVGSDSKSHPERAERVEGSTVNKDSTPLTSSGWNDKKDGSRFTLHIPRLILYAAPGFREPLAMVNSFAQAFAKATRRWIPLQKLSLVTQIRDRLRSQDYKEARELQDIFLATIDYDLGDAMAKIDLRTLLIWGENDREVPLKIGQAMQEAIPNAELNLIPKAGHFAHLENPTLFAGLIRSFVKK